MSGCRLRSEPTHSKVTEGEWVDFPASPDPFPWEALLGGANRPSPDISPGHDLNAKRGGVVMTSVAIALRGLLVTTAAVATVAYLLLTNSHI